MAKILIIDDEEQVRTFIRKILQLSGHEVIEASNGKIGMKLYAANPTDLIITDLIMPEKEGIETILEIKGSNPNAKIIAISGGGQVLAEDYLCLAKGLGALCTLTKPFSRAKMLEAVNKLLEE
jgi:YesN/AraC family two-component response regulator